MYSTEPLNHTPALVRLNGEPYPSTTRGDTPGITQSRRQRIAEFERCESQLLTDPGACPQSCLLNQYLDAGLDLAEAAGRQQLLSLQESWLRRTWVTLRNSALLGHRNEAWSHQCLIGLYQLFFVFRHLLQERPDSKRRLLSLTRDMSLMSRHLF